ncbi:MAG: hypothetical protein D3906_10415, partial [Candidatus Electrothrix sp. AUS1_2]|nr:hypothetical protein [Candidatus Electrothrix sp. AUS1_2]
MILDLLSYAPDKERGRFCAVNVDETTDKGGGEEIGSCGVQAAVIDKPDSLLSNMLIVMETGREDPEKLFSALLKIPRGTRNTIKHLGFT